MTDNFEKKVAVDGPVVNAGRAWLVHRSLGIDWNYLLNGNQAMFLVILASAWKQISYNFLFFLAMTSGQHAEQPPAKRRGPKPAIWHAGDPEVARRGRIDRRRRTDLAILDYRLSAADADHVLSVGDQYNLSGGIQPSYAFVAEPQTNGVAERFNRTLKEQIIHGRIYRQHRGAAGTPSATSSNSTMPSGSSKRTAT